MPYTWTGSSALGFDLSRVPAGPDVAGILLSALASDGRYAADLARRPVAPGEARARAAALAEAAQAVTGTVEIVDLTDGAGRADPVRDLSRIARRVRAITFGGPMDVIDLLRRDGLAHLASGAAGPPAASGPVRGLAVRHLSDALLAALAGEPAADLEVLAEAYRCTEPPPDAELGPYSVDVRDLLDGVRAAGRAADPYGLLADTVSPPGDWSRSMHVASWAVELTGRTRCAAAAHMSAVVALADAGFTGADAAAGAWNALSGMVVARLVADLLPEADHALLAGDR